LFIICRKWHASIQAGFTRQIGGNRAKAVQVDESGTQLVQQAAGGIKQRNGKCHEAKNGAPEYGASSKLVLNYWQPSLRNNQVAGQKPVRALWMRFRPMNTVSQINAGCTQ